MTAGVAVLLGRLGFRRNEHGAESSAPPRDRVDPKPPDLVVAAAVRAHVVDNSL